MRLLGSRSSIMTRFRSKFRLRENRQLLEDRTQIRVQRERRGGMNPQSVNRKLCGLYLGIMNRMGLKADKFGDATAPLAGL